MSSASKETRSLGRFVFYRFWKISGKTIRGSSLAVNRIHQLLLLFFFSSRRRHTRCSRDWSSDVCSSDLARDQVAQPYAIGQIVDDVCCRRGPRVESDGGFIRRQEAEHDEPSDESDRSGEIGRASGRERG